MGRINRTIEVDAPISRCFELWSHFPSFPRFMKNIENITPTGDPRVWRWTVKGPLGRSVTFDAEVDALEPNQVVSWHTVRDAEVDHAGAVTFEEQGPNRTRIHVSMVYNPPAGKVGEVVADLFKNPDKMVEEDLENFRQVVTSTPTYAV